LLMNSAKTSDYLLLKAYLNWLGPPQPVLTAFGPGDTNSLALLG